MYTILKMELVLRFVVDIGVILAVTTFHLVTAENPTTFYDVPVIEGSQLPRLTKQPVNIRTPLGSTVRSVCEGYFGQLNNETTDVDWGPTNEEDYQYLERNRQRFQKSKTYERDEFQIKGMNLTVINVTNGDYNITLMCTLSTAVLQNPSIHRDFKILPPIPVDVHRDDLGKIIAPVLVSTVAMVSVVAAFLYCVWGPQIGLYVYSRCARPASPENFSYDGIVIHDEANNAFAIEHLKAYLSGLTHLKVEFLGRCLSRGAPLFEGIQDLIRESFCVIFVVTPDVNPVLYGHLLRAARELRRKIVVIMAHPEGLKLQRWHQENNSSTELRDLQKKYLRYLLSIRWPGHKASSRRRKNFWCTLRRQLPLSPRSSTAV